MIKKLWAVAIVVAILVFAGCSTLEKIGRVVASDVVDEAGKIAEEEMAKVTDKIAEVKEKVAVKDYVVEKGDCLWTISEDQYGDPFLWTAIYKDNRDSIENPNIIEIDQELKVRYDHSSNDWAKARKEAYEYGE